MSWRDICDRCYADLKSRINEQSTRLWSGPWVLASFGKPVCLRDLSPIGLRIAKCFILLRVREESNPRPSYVIRMQMLGRQKGRRARGVGGHHPAPGDLNESALSRSATSLRMSISYIQYITEFKLPMSHRVIFQALKCCSQSHSSETSML
jgi:hypothetical protein